jgi:site-specific recombinase XerD
MDQLIQRFLLYLRAERNASAHTLRAYQHDLKEFNAFLKAKYPRLSMERHHRLVIRDYLAHLHDNAIQRAAREGEPRPRRATLLRAIAVLRAFYKFLVQEGLTHQTPFVGLPMPKREMRLPRFLQEEEMTGLLELAGHSKQRLAWRDAALLELLYSSGLRIQELCQLNAEDIDLWSGMVRVFGKGAKERMVPVGKTALERIHAYLESRRRPLSQRESLPAGQAGVQGEGQRYRRIRKLQVSPREKGLLARTAVPQPTWRKALRSGCAFGGCSMGPARCPSEKHQSALLSPLLRDPPFESRMRPADGTGNAGASESGHHPSLYACHR